MGTHITILEALIVSAVSIVGYVFIKTAIEYFFTPPKSK